jgi:transcriptional regulator with XRE-family HTH domain
MPMGVILYKALRGKMAEHGFTQASLAKAAGIKDSSFSNKLNGKTRWMADEAYRIMILIPELEITDFLEN